MPIDEQTPVLIKSKRVRNRTNRRFDFNEFCVEHVNVSECFVKDCTVLRKYIAECPDDENTLFCEEHDKITKCFSSECPILINRLCNQFSNWQYIRSITDPTNSAIYTDDDNQINAEQTTEVSDEHEFVVPLSQDTLTDIATTHALSKPNNSTKLQPPNPIVFVKPAIPSTSKIISSSDKAQASSTARTPSTTTSARVLKSVVLERCDKVISSINIKFVHSVIQ